MFKKIALILSLVLLGVCAATELVEARTDQAVLWGGADSATVGREKGIAGSPVIVEFEGDVELDGSLSIPGNLTVADKTYLQGEVAVTGASTFASTVGVTGKLTTTADAEIGSDLTVVNKLYVTGAADVTGDVVLNSDLSVGDLFVDQSTGRVGIGTTTPAAGFSLSIIGGLDVTSGSTHFANYTQMDNTTYGHQLVDNAPVTFGGGADFTMGTINGTTLDISAGTEIAGNGLSVDLAGGVTVDKDLTITNNIMIDNDIRISPDATTTGAGTGATDYLSIWIDNGAGTFVEYIVEMRAAS